MGLILYFLFGSCEERLLLQSSGSDGQKSV